MMVIIYVIKYNCLFTHLCEPQHNSFIHLHKMLFTEQLLPGLDQGLGQWGHFIVCALFADGIDRHPDPRGLFIRKAE